MQGEKTKGPIWTAISHEGLVSETALPWTWTPWKSDAVSQWSARRMLIALRGMSCMKLVAARASAGVVASPCQSRGAGKLAWPGCCQAAACILHRAHLVSSTCRVSGSGQADVCKLATLRVLCCPHQVGAQFLCLSHRTGCTGRRRLVRRCGRHGEVQFGIGALDGQGSLVILPCGFLCRVKGAQPEAHIFGGIADLGGILAPGPQANTAVPAAWDSKVLPLQLWQAG